MSLARAWRRQLYGASSAALIVPSAMLAALVVLALGGGFNQVGVLGQIFAGPPALGAGALSGGGGGAGGARFAASSLPVIPGVAVIRTRRPSGRAGGPTSSGVSNRTGGAGVAPIVTGTPIRSAPRPAPGAPSRPVPAPGSGSGSGSHPPSPSPSPPPSPPPKSTLVDPVVTVVTRVTQQLPAPIGPAATQAVQAAGSAADGVLPPAPPGTLP